VQRMKTFAESESYILRFHGKPVRNHIDALKFHGSTK
jgi:hypothetical protein